MQNNSPRTGAEVLQRDGFDLENILLKVARNGPFLDSVFELLIGGVLSLGKITSDWSKGDMPLPPPNSDQSTGALELRAGGKNADGVSSIPDVKRS